MAVRQQKRLFSRKKVCRFCVDKELGIDYTVKLVDITSGDQHKPDFRALNPNGRIPVIVDRANDDFAIFEAGAIMV